MKTYGSVVRYFGHLLHEQYTLCILTQYTLRILTQYTLHNYYTNSILCYHVAPKPNIMFIQKVHYM